MRTVPDHDHPTGNVQLPMNHDRNSPTKLGMLLVGHGTRNERGLAEFFETAEMIACLMRDVEVQAGLLELARPSISEAFERLVERGVNDVIVVPLLLFAAGHAKQDIPDAIATASSRFPNVRIRQAPPLGCHEKILATSVQRFQSILPPDTSDPATDVALVMVSRGTSDMTAIADVMQFTRLRLELTPVAFATTAFMAVARPSVASELAAVQQSPHPRVVVQPLLLFQGQLTNDLHTLVTKNQRDCPKKQWLVADHLGACSGVAEAAVSRFWATADLST